MVQDIAIFTMADQWRLVTLALKRAA